MEQDPRMMEELQMLKKKVGRLEADLIKQKSKGPLAIFSEAAGSLLVGLFLVGPALALVMGFLYILLSWLGAEI